MCRMLIAVGKVNLSWLIDDFIIMANDENEKHENNEDQSFKHDHGWGIVYLKDGEMNVYKSTKPCYEDEEINSFRKLISPLYILHARKGSEGRGGVEMVNVHPFQYENYVFCHNGTVYEELSYDERFTPQGETDSEMFFYYLMSGITNRIDEQIIYHKSSRIKDFSGLNSILSDGENSFIINWYKKNPRYYTLKILATEESVIISSEILPHFKNDNWREMKNGEICKLNTLTRKYNVRSSSFSL